MINRRARYFDEKDEPEAEDVRNAAAILDIREFDLFRIAYFQWHGNNVGDADLEPFFAGYMFKAVVPPWVRHFSRTVVRLDQEGRLRPEQFGLRQLVATPRMVGRGIRYAVVLMLVLATLLVLAEFSHEVLVSGCQFPPCY